MKTSCMALAAAVFTLSGAAQTYIITDLGTLGTNASFATGVNNSGQVSGYSVDGANAARAWRHSPGSGLTDLGSFGGTDTRASAINNAGQVTGYSTDQNGVAHGFVLNNGALKDIGGFGGGADVFPQSINTPGQVAGYSQVSNADRPFLFTETRGFTDLGTIASTPPPAMAAAYGINDSGRVVGIGTGLGGFNRAFRSSTNGVLEELGTLGGDESWARAINSSNQVVGSASTLTADSHAFRFTEGGGMGDLGTLGGYDSTAFGIDRSGNVVGSAEIASRELHAFVWSPNAGMRDLNELVPVNAGWTLTEGRGLNDSGVIVGNGLHDGQPRAFLLTPFTGPDTSPPVALLQADNITNITFTAHLFRVAFWDNVGVEASSIGTNALRVSGPGGFDQVATVYGPPLTNNGIRLTAAFYIVPPQGVWNGTNNGVYSVSIEPDTVRDVIGNLMPGGVIGTFNVTTETQPIASLSAESPPVMNQSSGYRLTALSSFPHDPADLFDFTIDWDGDGSDVQSVSGPTGTPVTHAFTSIGAHTVRVGVIDPHGVTGADSLMSLFVANPPFPNAWTAAPGLTGDRRQAVGLNVNGTLLCLGGLPLKGSRLQAQTLAPGAGAFVDAQRLNAATLGLGAGIDALNRIVVYGGIEPNAATPNVNGYVYDPGTGVGASIASKKFPVHDFAFCADAQHRLYSIGGATGTGTTTGTASVERYDATTDSWTTLAPLPAPRINATATHDGLGHLLVFGGLDPATGLPTSGIYSYDLATDSWSQLGDAPAGTFGPTTGRVAVLGADGMVCLVGGLTSSLTPVADVLLLDPARNQWFLGPRLITARGRPAVALGNDGFLYAMGGDGPANGGGGGGNNGLGSVERLDTGSTHPPRIISSPVASVQAGSPFSYQIFATGIPRPTYSLAGAPGGMEINPASGLVVWTPTTNQVGSQDVTVRATSAAGGGGQRFTLNVTPLPGDLQPPTAPTNFFAAFRTSTNILFTWSDATDDIGVVGYNLYNYVGSRSRHWALVAGGITNRSVHYPGGSFYPLFGIAAVDAAGNVSPLRTCSANTLTLPFITHANAAEPSTVILGGAFLFTLSASATPSPAFSSVSGPAGMTLTRVAGPNPLNDYAVVEWQPTAAQVGTNHFTVFATNANTTGGSATFTAVVLPGGTDLIPPSPVAQMVPSGVSFDHCDLAWTPAGDNVGIANYHLVATHFGAISNHVVVLDVPGTRTATVLSGLLPDSIYLVTITPSDAAGNVGAAAGIFLTTPAQPDRTLHLAPGATSGTLLLTWNGAGPQWRFTIESSASITAPDWAPVAPANQWPGFQTNLVITPDGSVPVQFYRVVPALAPP